MPTRTLAALLPVLLVGIVARAADSPSPSAVERGRHFLLEKSYSPAAWPLSAYGRAGQSWVPPIAANHPDYDRLFRERYGLHLAPYPNHGLPMGLKRDKFLGFTNGVTLDCLICHGGSIVGQSYVGLGNSTLDLQALFEDLARASGRPANTFYQFCRARGTNEAGATAVFLLGLREPDLRTHDHWANLGLHDDLCEDVPAWWLLKKKKTMYHTGGSDARSVRALMQFMMSPLNSPKVFARSEAEFRDIRSFILSLQPPKYPFPIDRQLAAKGERVFRAHCSRCHGTYGPNWTYPNKIVPLAEIGTDRHRYDGITEAFGRYYNQSWFAQEEPGWLLNSYTVHPTAGYQAPPLDGIWATAPYLHNGSVPTVHDLLKSSSRPARFTRSFRTDASAYDPVKLGWKVTEAPPLPLDAPAIERRKIYDTHEPGRGNGGHTFGDHLSEAERLAVIEYLKTL